MSKGKGREWGYASSDEKGNLTYTSYEKSGAVNRYSDNGDGGHSHEHWKNKDDYNKGKEADQTRKESSKRRNPSTGDVQDNGGCYLTTACLKAKCENFVDDCYELTVLRWFRDQFVSQKDVKNYYCLAPQIIEFINNTQFSDEIYDYIYDSVVDYCVEKIECGLYDEAYNRYKQSVISLEKHYTKTNKI